MAHPWWWQQLQRNTSKKETSRNRASLDLSQPIHQSYREQNENFRHMFFSITYKTFIWISSSKEETEESEEIDSQI